jgi:Organic solute transporter Ostalpha
MSIKVTLFLSIWQKEIMHFLDLSSIVDLVRDKKGKITHLEVEHYLDNLLIVIEMFVLSLIIRNCYSYIDFHKGINGSENSQNSIFKIPKLL